MPSFGGAIREPSGSSRQRAAAVLPITGDEWDSATFQNDGMLYKADSTGDYSYRGDDAAAYQDVFEQETYTKREDLSPLIEFLRFVNTSDDAAVAAGLPDRLDVAAFADYLAFEELVDNFDDIDGPGNNSYLRYDKETERFTVIAWDHNLAFGLFPMAGAGGFPRPPTNVPGGPGGGSMFARQNVLVDRFKANAEFAAAYTSSVAELRATLYESGVGTRALERRVKRAEEPGFRPGRPIDSRLRGGPDAAHFEE